MGRKPKGTKRGQNQAGKKRPLYKKRKDAKWSFVSYRVQVLAETDGLSHLSFTGKQTREYVKKAKDEWEVEEILENHPSLAACFGVLEHDDSGSDEPGIREPDWRWAINGAEYYGVKYCKEGARCPHCVNWSARCTSNSLQFRRETVSPNDRWDRHVFRSAGVSPRHWPGLDPPPPSP